MPRRIEIVRESTLALDAAPERNALEIAFEVVAPLMIGAAQDGALPNAFWQISVPRWAQLLSSTLMPPSLSRTTSTECSPMIVRFQSPGFSTSQSTPT